MKVEVYKSAKNKQWYWRIVATNKHVLATSETYTAKRAAVRVAKRMGARLNAAVEFPEVKPAPRKRAKKVARVKKSA